MSGLTHVSARARVVLGLGLLLAMLPAAARAAPPCAHPKLIRLNVKYSAGLSGDHPPPSTAELVADLKSMLLNLQDLVELKDPVFAYLGGLKLIHDAEVPDWNRFERQSRLKVLLQILVLVVIPEGDRVKYQSTVLLRGCELASCTFEEVQTKPPPQRYATVKNQLRILTLYALAMNAREADCPNSIVKPLLDATDRLIREVRAKNLKFDGMDEVGKKVAALILIGRTRKAE